jgi:hypothetical protein
MAIAMADQEQLEEEDNDGEMHPCCIATIVGLIRSHILYIPLKCAAVSWKPWKTLLTKIQLFIIYSSNLYT